MNREEVGRPDVIVAVIDDQRINQLGTCAVLREVSGVEVPDAWVLDFDQALSIDDWSSIDVVVADVACESAEVDRTPCVAVARHIRECCDGPRPFVVAVTSNPLAYDEPLVHRRLLDADPNIGLVWRKDLDELIATAIDEGFFEDVPLLIDAGVPEEFPELGIGRGADLESIFEEGRDITEETELKGRRLVRRRIEAAARSGLKAVTRDGNAPYTTDTPSVPQWRRIVARFQINPDRHSDSD